MIGEIIQEFATPITVHRSTAATTFVDGIEQISTTDIEFVINKVSVQPVLGRERENLPELIRDREVIKLYTQTQLKSVDVEGKKHADRIDWQDQEYVVQSVEDWTLHGGYYKCTAVKEND